MKIEDEKKHILVSPENHQELMLFKIQCKAKDLNTIITEMITKYKEEKQ